MSEEENTEHPRADYEVGYGRPPKATRFKPGQSGNPKGRKRKPRSLKDEMRSIMKKPIAIKENGQTKRMPLQKVTLRSVAKKAAQGDLRAASFVINLMNSEEADKTDILDAKSLSPEDQKLFDEMMQELDSSDGSAAIQEDLNEQEQTENDT